MSPTTMYTTISLFYASLIAMIVMVVLKYREEKTGHPTIISRMFAWSDSFFSKAFSLIREAISYINKHTFISLAQWVAYHILRHIRMWYIEVRSHAHRNPHTKKVVDMVRGRGEIKKHGASIYLKRISNDS
jgi:hypothetical protein